MNRMLLCGLMVLSLAAPALAIQPPTGADDFVPAGALPPVDALPAAPVVIAAYAFVWIALIGYVWYIWRRLQKVEQDIAALERLAKDR